MNEGQAALVWCPFPDTESAREIAAKLLSEKLIACANIIAGVESVYEWEGKVESAREVGVLFKTTSNSLDALVARLGELHPYDTPAILGSVCDAAHSDTLSWLHDTVK